MVGFFAFIFVFGVIIIVHEFGHYYFAKKAGVLCHEFSFGMGPLLWSIKKGETQFSVRLFLIGGYVMMAGEDQETSMIKQESIVKLKIKDGIVEKIILDLKNEKYKDLEEVEVVDIDLYGKDGDMFIVCKNDFQETKYLVKRDGSYVYSKKELQFSPYERCMESRTLWQRTKAVFGGPLMNFLLAIVVFIIIGLVNGKPNFDSTVLNETEPGTPSYIAGLRESDKIIKINDNELTDWADLAAEVDKNIGGNVLVEWETPAKEIKEEWVVPQVIFYSAGFLSDHTVTDKLVVTEINKNSISYGGGLRNGDEIIKVNGDEVNSWQLVSEKFSSYSEATEVNLTVIRDGVEKDINFTTYSEEVISSQGVELVDSYISVSPVRTFNIFYAIKSGFTNSYATVKSVGTTFKLLITSSEIGIFDLSGPVGIYIVTNEIATGGFLRLLGWLGMLSINVGVLNILPIPALDGGRLIFLGYEGISKKRVSRTVENRIHNIGYIALLGLIFLITFKDIFKLFR